MSDSGPKPYNVVYDAVLGAIQYSYQSGYVTIPEASANAITALTGDVTATGPGSAAATIAAGAITNAKVNATAAIAYSKLALTNSIVTGDLTSALITPAKISTTSTDDFSFPRDLTVKRNLFVYPDLVGGACAPTFGNASTGSTTVNLKTGAGNQAGIVFNANGDKWETLLNSDGTYDIYDTVNGVFCHTTYPHGGESLTRRTTTQRDALTAVAGMMIYNTTTSAIEVWDGTAWSSFGTNIVLPNTSSTIALAGATPTLVPCVDVSVNGVVFSPEIDVWKSGSAGAENSDKAAVIIGQSSGELAINSQSNANPLLLEFPGTIVDDTASFSNPVASAVLQVTSTTRGFLPPVMTTVQKNAIASPAEGLVVYDTTLHKLSLFTGTVWETVTSA